MSSALDRSLDDILAERRQEKKRDPPRGDRGDRGGANRRRDRSDNPRDGVRKSFRDDTPRGIDSEWVHDKFEDYGNRRSGSRYRRSPDTSSSELRGTKLRVDNLHYELTQDDLEGLFSRIGPLVTLELKYDRAGRSEGTAFVTYESHRDALQAIKEFDGANAAGQPIRLTLLPSGPSGRRGNPFDTAIPPSSRPLAERITVPGQQQGRDRDRSLSPGRGGRHRDDLSDEEARRRGVDRYRPRGGGGGRGGNSDGRLSRSRSPLPGGGRRRGEGGGGRRSGPRRDGAGGGRGRGGGGGGNARPKKTQEELDAEMEDYFASMSGGGASGDANAAAPAAAASGGAAAAQGGGDEDVDMIE
ncbi:hypothetical protein VTJ04DRAFT_3368 [Mycothermus thermophilus]|uniref:uncharacterized protein n=1 Tax=Humicola insolens TaxID=85995 RepID=UPI0037427CE8